MPKSELVRNNSDIKHLWQRHDYSEEFCFPKDGIISWQFREKDEDKMRRRCITSLTGRDNERQQVFTGEDDHTRFLECDRTDRGKLKIYLHVLKDRNFRFDP